MIKPTLVKVGGAELKEGPDLDVLVAALEDLAKHGPLVVVHGGGSEIADLQKRLGLQPRVIEGLRVTDDASLRVAEMVLSGAVNKRLVARLVVCGVRAIGLSGVDSGILRAQRLRHPAGDLGRVGEITAVDTQSVLDLLSLGFTPIISPISLGEDGRPYNVNADHAALAVASALGVSEMVFLTDVPGVLSDGRVLTELTISQAENMIAQGQITGGMIPKVRAALQAVGRGVAAARITNLAGLGHTSGTRVIG